MRIITFIEQIIFIFLLIGLNAYAQEYNVIKIADLNTAIPEGVGNFENFNELISTDNGGLAFTGGNESEFGIYNFMGDNLQVLADLNTSSPSGLGNFDSFFDLTSLGNGKIAFQSQDLSVFHTGIYISQNGVISLLVDTDDIPPSVDDSFKLFQDIIPLGIDDVAFISFTLLEGPFFERGVYAVVEEVLTTIADKTIPFPDDDENFSAFGIGLLTSLGNDDLIFLGGSDSMTGIIGSDTESLNLIINLNAPVIGGEKPQLVSISKLVTSNLGNIFLKMVDNRIGIELEGIYQVTNNNFKKIVDTTTSIPNGFGAFNGFNDPVPFGGNTVAFHGVGQLDQEGIYMNEGNNISVLVDSNTTLPNSDALFTEFSDPVYLGSGNFAFAAEDTFGGLGIYVNINGNIVKVVDNSTSVPESNGLFNAFNGLVSLGNGDVAFLAEGSMGEFGVYKAELIANELPGNAAPPEHSNAPPDVGPPFNVGPPMDRP